DWAGFAINAAFGFPCLLGAGALIKYGVKFAAKKGMKEIGKALGERIVSDIPAHHLKLITSHAGSDAAKASLEQVAKLAEGGALEQAAKKIENVVSREVSLATQQCVKQFPVAKNVCDTFKWLATCKRGEIAKQLQEAGYGKLNSHMTAHCMKRCAVKYGRSGEKALAKGLERGLAESLDSGLRKPIQEQFFKTFDKGLKETAEKLKLSDDAVKAIREAAEKGFDEGFEKGLKRGVRAAIKDGLKQYHKALKKLKHGRFPDFDGPDFLKDRDKNKTPQVAALGLPKTAKLPPAEDLEEVRKKRLPEELTGRKRRLDDDPLPKNLGFDDHLQVAKAREKAKAAREAELTSAAPQARPIKEARNNESNN
ncbi:MAG: hypothetical protein DCC75_09380, partial [Proteobacteria bacterium]